MANDRMILRCKVCGEEQVIAKTFGNGYELTNEEEINAFFRKHAFCNADKHEACKFQDFELHYESE